MVFQLLHTFKMKILIIDSDVWMNKGGGGIVLGMVEVLEDILNEPDIVVQCNNPDACRRHLDWDGVTFHKVVPPYARNITQMLPTLLSTTKQIFQKNFSSVPLVGETTIKDIQDADLVLGAGGGYIGGDYYLSVLSAYRLWIAKQLGKPVAIGPNTVEPFEFGVLEYFTIKFLKSVDHIMAREHFTVNYLDDLGLGGKTSFVPDAVFNMRPDSSIKGKQLLSDEGVPNTQCIGVTVRDWHFKETNNPEYRRYEYIRSVSSLLEHISDCLNCHPVLVRQVHRDLNLSRTVARHSSLSSEEFTVITGKYTPRQIVSMMEEFELLIGTRLHSVLMSLVAGTATGAIGYGMKSEAIMDHLGFHDEVVPIGQVSPDDLKQMSTRLFENKGEYEQRTKSRIKEVRSDATNQWGIILGDLL